MTAPQMIGLIGGAVGGAMGLMGGAIGTYFSIKNTRTEAERRFQIRCAAVMWVLTLSLILAPLPLVLLGLIRRWQYWTVWAVYMVLLVLLIPRLNRRANELGGPSQSAQSPESPDPI